MKAGCALGPGTSRGRGDDERDGGTRRLPEKRGGDHVLRPPPRPASSATRPNPADPTRSRPRRRSCSTQAAASSACSTPWIALNELFGSRLAAPWTATTPRTAPNVLALDAGAGRRRRASGAVGAREPHGRRATASWWRQVAQSADDRLRGLLRRHARIYPIGPGDGEPAQRLGIRSVVAHFESADVAADTARDHARLPFRPQTPGIAGRQGLEPTEAWLRVVKWEALAARQVATEEHLSSIWSWGWGTFGPESVDEDKAAAACAYLWTRDPTCCDAPAEAAGGLQHLARGGADRAAEGRRVHLRRRPSLAGGGGAADAAHRRTARRATALFARASLSRACR